MSLVPDKSDISEEKPRVLVVDDEYNIRQAIFYVLHSEFDVTVVESGNNAVEKIKQGLDFDVVTLDLQMPGMSGLETLKAIKRLCPMTEVLIVTAHANFEAAKGALRYGAYEYINKPFNNRELRGVVREGVKRRSRAIGAETAREQLEFVKAQLIESEKFSEIGKLITGVTHELNNPLSAIMGFSEIPLMTECSAEDARSYFEKINRSALLCKNIIENLLSFSRKSEPKKELLQINPVIKSTMELKEHDLQRDGIELIDRLSNDIPPIMADVNGLQQVFLNMINNAHQAMKSHGGDGILKIQSECDEQVVRVSFLDTGPGIPRENLQKIFEPLFTTKERGEGTGLGLSICYEIVKEHGGNILVASEEGAGACFIVEIPIAPPDLDTP